jgi:hypothetical protein
MTIYVLFQRKVSAMAVYGFFKGFLFQFFKGSWQAYGYFAVDLHFKCITFKPVLDQMCWNFANVWNFSNALESKKCV